MFSYTLGDNMTIKELLGNTLTIAKQPEDNPTGLSTSRYTVAFVEHDYPAVTPKAWNPVYRAFGINDVSNIMIIGNTQDIPKILDACREDKRYLGGGAGVGFKDEIIKYLDELDPMAKATGAVNIIVKTKEGNLRGYNTDGIGYVESLKSLLKSKGCTLKDSSVLMLGAGGTGNAIALALTKEGAKLVILNRTVEKAQALADRVNFFMKMEVAKAGSEDDITDESMKSDIIINVSTKGAIGKFEDYSAFASAGDDLRENIKSSEEVVKKLSKDVIISDIVLRDGLTPTLALAKKYNLDTLDGVRMGLNQGIEAFWLVHGEELKKLGKSKEEVVQVMSKALKT